MASQYLGPRGQFRQFVQNFFFPSENTLVGTAVAPFQHALQLLVSPRIEVDGLHSADMGAHSTVDARAADADEDAQVPGRPSGVCQNSCLVSACSEAAKEVSERSTLVPLAVCAGLVRLQLQQVLDGLLVLRSPGRVWSPRHGGEDAVYRKLQTRGSE